MVLKNVAGTTIGAQSEQLPQNLSMGVRYEITEHSRLAADLEKDIRYPIIKKFGYEQQILGVLYTRLGISDNPDRFSFGLGITAATFEFAHAGYCHPRLGWTRQVELSVSLSP